MIPVPINDLSRWNSGEVEEIANVVQQICAAGHFMLGPYTAKLEASLAGLVHQPHVVCVANGTDALTLAMQGVGVKRGSVVVTVANAGGYTTTAALRLGAVMILVDIDPANGQMAVESLANALTTHPRIDAIVVTHLYGLMAPIAELAELCRERNIPLIEDCAQAIGAEVDGRPAGSWGDASTFSFYPTKNLGCLGDGGAVALNNETIARRVRQLAQYGWGGRYSVELSGGFNSRIDEIQAAILLLRLRDLSDGNIRRRQIVSRYSAALTGTRRMLWQDDPSFVGHLAIMVTKTRDSDKRILDDAQIGTGVHYPITDHSQVAWKLVFDGQTSPGADVLASQILTLPCFPKMTEVEVDAVCTALGQLSYRL